MSSRTKIVVLHMKEIIYTAIFAALALLVIVLLIFMFGTGKKDSAVKNEKQYTPGTYTSTLTLNNTNLEVEVSVDAYKINSIRFSNLDETVTTMFPLIQPAIEEIAEQIYETQSPDSITLSEDTPYVATYIGRRFRSRRKSRSKITAAFSLCCLIFIQQYLTNIIHTFAFTGIILQRSNTFRPAKRTLPKLPQDLLRTFRPHLLPLLQSILSPRQ